MKRVFYHGGCMDGTASAWAAFTCFGGDAAYTPVSYGRKPPRVYEEDEVFLLDFCYKPEELGQMADSCESLVIIDHHKSNGFLDVERDTLDALGLDNVEIVFDLEHSGAVLAWHYFYPESPIPLLLRYVEDRDIWKWELNHSMEVSAYLQSLHLDPPTFGHEVVRMKTELTDDPHPSKIFNTTAYKEGKAILRSHQVLTDQIVRIAEVKDFCGHKVPMVCSPILHSEVGHALLQRYPEAPFAVTYRDIEGIRSFSLRSEDDREDVSVIAKENGGGGHRNAAGFEVELSKNRIKYGESD